MTMLKTLLQDERGQGMTEYAILVGTLALGAIASLNLIGGKIQSIFKNVNTQLSNVPTS